MGVPVSLGSACGPGQKELNQRIAQRELHCRRMITMLRRRKKTKSGKYNDTIQIMHDATRECTLLFLIGVQRIKR